LLTRHPHADGSYVLTSVSHSASEGGFLPGSEIGENHYSNIFYTMPLSLPYRPQPTASKPHVWGCQTAVVVGPAGEEIYTDKYGRVKVQFHWDREGKNNDASSCWIRFASFWAGKAWGAIHIPRIGQEVIVDFLEGDPDKPIIVGSVYNASNLPPFSLPGSKTQSGIKSESSKGGGGYNQILFEDLKGKEEIIIHAQKNMTLKVEKDRFIEILNDDKAKITNNRSTEVGVDYKTKVGGKREINAGKEITLETGASKIVMKASGEIEISGVNITISASASLKAKGLTTDLTASTINTIKGTLVKIN
jgi:type VI secretion system secreted protein VgrG